MVHPQRHEPRSLNAKAFTLMELVVSIAAVTVISVGLAALFSSVGKTVTGGKRVSLLNNYAGLIESRMRRDFDAMTRDGFLVIRQQWVQENPQPVVDANPQAANDRIPVGEDDAAPRRRRADEILFFVTGASETARQSLSPSARAVADQSMIYYGHGQGRRNTQPTTPTSPYFRPEVDDTNADANARLGFPAPTGAPNPNRFAGAWTVTRQETLLVKPSTTQVGPPRLTGLPANSPRLVDSDVQIQLQPAAASIFRILNLRGADPAPGALIRNAGANALKPHLGSGIVDIATTDLNEIRLWASTCSVLPSNILSSPNVQQTLGKNVAPTLVGAPPFVRPAQNAAQSVDRMHAWMDQAFPAQSAASPAAWGLYPLASEVAGMRVRAEPQPTGLFDALRGATTTGIEKAYRRADQLMLSSQNFLPHCSDLTIEWSFGATDVNGQIVWHGPRRALDANGNGLPDAGEPTLVLPYPDVATGGTAPFSIRFPVVGSPNPGTHTYSQRLIYGFTPAPDASVITSYFGYFDPTFIPPIDGNGDGIPDAGQPAVGVVPWPWPRMIRVSVTLADAQDPTIENTFQYIFTTPGDPGL